MKQLADWLSNDISKYTSDDNNSNSNSSNNNSSNTNTNNGKLPNTGSPISSMMVVIIGCVSMIFGRKILMK